jgi:hypothetical protein
VACDDCGRAAGEADDAQGALVLAREIDLRRIRRDGRMVDLCRRCRGQVAAVRV